jgi:ABC-type enterochelin transport system substrate-binding protein
MFGLSPRTLAWICVAVLAVAVILMMRSCVTDEREAAQSAGRAEERAEAAEAQSAQVEKANEAEDAVRRSPDARNAECMRHARNPQDC